MGDIFIFIVAFDNNIIMRSISIVYKKSKHQLLEDNHPLTQVKRSVDEYYGRLVEKEKNKAKMDILQNEIKERYKLQTSQSQKRADKFNILSTLSIAPMSIIQPPQLEKKYESTKKIIIFKTPQRSKSVFKGLKLPEMFQHIEQQQNPQKNLHCKLKKIYINKSSERRDTVVVISANLILNEHYFWDQENVDDQVAKYWKNLQNYINIAIVCEKQYNCKILLRFFKFYNLKIDGIYLIMPLKQPIKNLTVSYHQIQNDFNIKFHQSNFPIQSKDERKMIVINGLSVQNTKELTYQCFYHAIPIIRNRRSVIHFTKVEFSDKHRFGNVIKILSHETPLVIFNINSILHDFSKKRNELLQPHKCNCHSKHNSKPFQDINILSKIEEIKNNYIHYFTQSLSQNLNDKIIYDQTQNSIQFIIGDILRRNLRVFKEYQEYIDSYWEYENAKGMVHDKTCKAFVNKSGINFKKYRNNTYLWQF